MGRGASAPAWFEHPPEPPQGILQGTGRSGGCTTAEVSQVVAARVAAFQLVNIASRAMLTQRITSRQYRTGSASTGRLDDQVEVLTRALAGKVLTRARIFAQATSWNSRGEAETYVILRADSNDVKELAASEIERLLRYGAPQIDAWPAPRRAAEPEPVQPVRTSNVPTLVLGFRTQLSPGASVDSIPLEHRQHSATVSANLLPSRAGLEILIAAEHRAEETAEFARPLSEVVALSRPTSMSGYLLAGRGALAVYTGYRRDSWTVRRGTSAMSLEGGTEAVVVGLGIPPFTEVRGSRFNAFVDGAVGHRLSELRAGMNAQLFSLGGFVSLHSVLEGSLTLTRLADATFPGLQVSASPSDQLVARVLRAEGGLELRIARTVSAFGGWRYTQSHLGIISQYAWARNRVRVFLPVSAVAPSVESLRFTMGVKLLL